MELPCEILLHMSKFMNFLDYKNLILALYPNGGEDKAVSEKLWQMSTYKYNEEFCNRKTFYIEFNYDPTRAREDRVLINVQSLLPAFGGYVPPEDVKFLSVPELSKFIIRQIRSTDTPRTQPAASNVQHTSYHCTWYTHTLEDRSHSHHLMWKHVYWWLHEQVTDHILWRVRADVPRTPWMYTPSRRIKKTASQVYRFLVFGDIDALRAAVVRSTSYYAQ